MSFSILEAKSKDYTHIANMIHETWAHMENKDWFVIDDKDYIIQGLESGSLFSLIAFDEGGMMAGLFVAEIPRLLEDNLGVEANLDAAVLNQVVHMDTVVVDPAYRGQGLQKTLMDLGEKYLVNQGYHYLMCTVHPDNSYSYHNIQSLGYELVTTKILYGGFYRALFMKRFD